MDNTMITAFYAFYAWWIYFPACSSVSGYHGVALGCWVKEGWDWLIMFL
jgi:hypothetical protein